jgi:Flp pilus assembly protein TadD
MKVYDHRRRCRKSHIKCFVVAAVCLVTACGAPLPTQEELKQDDLDSKASQLLRVGDTTRAGGDIGSAMQMYARASTLRPEWLPPVLRQAQTAQAAGLHSEAANAFRRAIEIDSANITAQLGLGRASLAQRDFNGALEAFTAAARLAPEDNRGYNGAGIALDMMGRHEEAQERYITGIERSPDNLPLKNNLGLSLALTENFNEAITLLKDASGETEAGVGTRQNLALVYGLSGDMDSAREAASIDLPPSDVANNLAFYDRLRAMPPGERTAQIFQTKN